MLSPVRYWSATKRNGPDPIISLMRAVPASAMMRAGMMNGPGAFGLPSTDSISGNGLLRVMLKAFAPSSAMTAPAPSSMRPRLSTGAHRFNDAMQSADVTGASSWNFRPSRKVKCQCSPSFETV